MCDYHRCRCLFLFGNASIYKWHYIISILLAECFPEQVLATATITLPKDSNPLN